MRFGALHANADVLSAQPPEGRRNGRRNRQPMDMQPRRRDFSDFQRCGEQASLQVPAPFTHGLQRRDAELVRESGDILTPRGRRSHDQIENPVLGQRSAQSG
jgi:hypothetical protein